MDHVRLVLCTFPDAEQARQIGTLAVKNQAIACVNLIPGIESIYRWQGKVESSREVLAIFKTTDAAYPAFAAWLATAHPYDTPEIIAIRPSEVDPRYLGWIVESVADDAR
ncbi:MAG: divalent-cation tolerance protein CutA [Luteolibacter sp.]